MLKIQKEFFQTTSLTYFLHTFTKSHPLRKSCLVSVRFKRISCIDIERSLQRGPRGLHRESWKMVEEFSAEREARTIASRYSIYRVFVRWDLVITWQNIFSFCRFVYNKCGTIYRPVYARRWIDIHEYVATIENGARRTGKGTYDDRIDWSSGQGYS